MSTSTFSAGTIIETEGRTYTLFRKVDEVTWQAEEMQTKRIREFTITDLNDRYAKEKLRFFCEKLSANRVAPKPPDYAPQEWEAAKVRRSYVMAVMDVPSTRARIKSIIQDIWQKLEKPEKAPNAATVMRWKQKFLRAGRDITALIDLNDAKGNRSDRYSKDVQAFIQDAISDVYMTRPPGSKQSTLDRAKALVNRENDLRPAEDQIAIPTLRLVKRMIADIPAYDQYAARYGRIPAIKKFRAVKSHRVTKAPLDSAEIDHSQFDLMIVDDVTGMPLGRPWLTACIDDFTRSILGACISFDPPSYLTVAKCLKHAFLPKTTFREEYPDIENPWLAYGVMRNLYMDNGVEFHSASLENACLSLGIEPHYSARKTPWMKPKIERWMGTVNVATTHENPGTTFSTIFEKDEYDPVKHAVIRYSTFRTVVMKWIADVYSQKPHRGLDGVPPAVMWAKSIAAEDIPLPDDPARLDAILGKSEARKLTHKGIELYGLFYNSSELIELRRALGDSLDVEIRIDTTDIGKIIVFSPDKRQMFTVPAINSEYAAGLSEFQHRICRRFARRENKFDSRGWLEAKLRIAEIIKGDIEHKKQRTRSKIARYRGDRALLEVVPNPETEIEQIPMAATPTVVETSIEPMLPTAATEELVTPRKSFTPIFRDRAAVAIVGTESTDE